jgi:hypothetical protein
VPDGSSTSCSGLTSRASSLAFRPFMIQDEVAFLTGRESPDSCLVQTSLKGRPVDPSLWKSNRDPKNGKVLHGTLRCSCIILEEVEVTRARDSQREFEELRMIRDNCEVFSW